MKFGKYEASVAAIVSSVTTFLGISGYLSTRAQANVLGLSRGTLSSNWHYVLDAVEFAATLLFLLLGSLLLAAPFVGAWLLMRKASPNLTARASQYVQATARSMYFAQLTALATLTFALWVFVQLANMRKDLVVGELATLPRTPVGLQGAFIVHLVLVFLCICLWLNRTARSLLFGNPANANLWRWTTAVFLLFLLALPVVYGAVWRSTEYAWSRTMGSAAGPDAGTCGLLVERNEDRAALWTAVDIGGRPFGVVREVNLDNATIEIGRLVDIRERVADVLRSGDVKTLCLPPHNAQSP